jgi:hypothetical protein
MDSGVRDDLATLGSFALTSGHSICLTLITSLTFFSKWGIIENQILDTNYAGFGIKCGRGRDNTL